VRALPLTLDSLEDLFYQYKDFNPAKLIKVNWKKINKIENFKRIDEFSGEYNYSNYLDYISKKNLFQ